MCYRKFLIFEQPIDKKHKAAGAQPHLTGQPSLDALTLDLLASPFPVEYIPGSERWRDRGGESKRFRDITKPTETQVNRGTECL